MPHCSKSESVYILPLRDSDLPSLFKIMSDKSTADSAGFEIPKSLPDVNYYVNCYRSCGYIWGVWKGRELIGAVSFITHSHLNTIPDGNIGIFLKNGMQGQGIGKVAMLELLQTVFIELKMPQIAWCYFRDNVICGKLLLEFGMPEPKVLFEGYYAPTRAICDFLCSVLTREEYLKRLTYD